MWSVDLNEFIDNLGIIQTVGTSLLFPLPWYFSSQMYFAKTEIFNQAVCLQEEQQYLKCCITFFFSAHLMDTSHRASLISPRKKYPSAGSILKCDRPRPFPPAFSPFSYYIGPREGVTATRAQLLWYSPWSKFYSCHKLEQFSVFTDSIGIVGVHEPFCALKHLNTVSTVVSRDCLQYSKVSWGADRSSALHCNLWCFSGSTMSCSSPLDLTDIHCGVPGVG